MTFKIRRKALLICILGLCVSQLTVYGESTTSSPSLTSAQEATSTATSATDTPGTLTTSPAITTSSQTDPETTPTAAETTATTAAPTTAAPTTAPTTTVQPTTSEPPTTPATTTAKPKVGLGEVCETKDDCNDDLAECVASGGGSEKRCTCPASHYPDSNMCKMKIDLGGVCTGPDQCKDGNAICSDSGSSKVCQCKTTHYPEGLVCQLKKGLGDTCKSTIECSPANSNCSVDNQCTCKDGYYEKDQACILKKDLGQSCLSGIECKDSNSNCTSGTCTCNPDFYQDNLVCKEKKDLGGSCTANEQCKDANAECTGQKCTCAPKFFPHENVCTERAKITSGAITFKVSGESFLEVEWSPAELADGYKVEWMKGGVVINTTVVVQPSINITGLTPGTKHKVKVTGKKGSEMGTTQEKEKYTKPAQPGLMMVKERDSTFLVVQWAAPPGVVKNYKVEATVGTVSTAISPSTERRIYDITTPGAEVTVTVTAISGEDALDKDLMGEPRIEKFKTKPASPTNVKVAELVSDPTKGLQVTWDNPNGNVDKYFVHYNTAVQVVPKTDAGGSTDLTDLIPGTQYTVYIESAVVEQSGDIINSTKSDQKVTRTKPATPGAIQEVVKDTTMINIKWTNSEGNVDTYVVSRNGTTIDENVSPGSTETTYQINGLAPGMRYDIKVKAKAGNLLSIESSKVIKTKEIPPTAPRELSLKDAVENSITAMWTPPATPNGDILRYKVYYATVDNSGNVGNEMVKTTADTSTELVINGLLVGQKYRFRVSAVNSAGEGDKSSFKDGSTVAGVAGVVNGFKVTSQTEYTFDTSWGYPTNPQGIIHYYVMMVEKGSPKTCSQGLIFRCSNCGTPDPNLFQKLTNKISTCASKNENAGDYVISSPVTHKVQNLLPYTVYTLTVYAANNKGLGTPSPLENKQTDEAVPTDYVTGVAVGAPTFSSLELTWTAPKTPNGKITKYEIKYEFNNYKTQGPKSEVTIDSAPDVTKKTVTGLRPFWEYTFKIAAHTAKGNGGLYSSGVTGKTLEAAPGQPRQFSNNPPTSDSVRVKWEPPFWNETNGVITGYKLAYYFSTNSKTEKTRNANEKQYDAYDLKSYKNYTFELQAKTSAGTGVAAKIIVTTDQAKPGKIESSSISFYGHGPNSLGIQWEEPKEPNGIIIAYHVQQSSSQSPHRTTPEETAERKLVFTGLQPDNTYQFQIAAETIKGIGPYSYGVSDRTRVGIPKKPGKPVGEALSPTSARITWTKPELKTGPTNYTGYAYVETETNTRKETVNGFDQTSLVIMNLPYAYWRYRFRVEAKTSAGATLSDFSDYIRTSPAAPAAMDLVDVKLLPGVYTLVWVDWRLPSLKQRNGRVKQYEVQYRGVKSDGEVYAPPPATFDALADDELKDIIKKSIPVKAEYTYTVKVRARNEGKNQNGEDLWGAFSNEKIVGVPAGQPPLPENEKNGDSKVVMPASGESGEQKKATFKLNKDYFTSQIHGVIKEIGIIIADVDAFDQSKYEKSPKLPRNEFNDYVRTAYRNWSQVKDQGNYPPYRATGPKFSLNTGGRRKRNTATLENFVAGADGESCTSGFCNGALQPGRSYVIRGFACTETYCSQSAWSAPVQTAANVVPAVVGALVALLIIIIIVVVLIFVMKRRGMGPFKRRAHPTYGGHDNPVFVSTEEDIDLSKYPRTRPVKLTAFAEHVRHMHRDTDLLFSEEYKMVKELGPKHNWEAAELASNRSKNRYTNILPFDHSRVKLLPTDEDESEGGSDYINANYMPGYKFKREFIAAQGPLPGTVDDFWRMIWEQNVSIVVMLTQPVERGRVKCEVYWPKDDDPKFYGDLMVTKRSESVLADYTIRLLDIKLGTSTRTVTQYHTHDWVDFAAPKFSMLEFVRAVRTASIRNSKTAPVLVHCSAGVGRTGTFIAVDFLLQHIREHSEMDVYGLVLRMRENRCNMVQTEDQYIYIHECIKDALVEMGIAAGNSFTKEPNGLSAEDAV